MGGSDRSCVGIALAVLQGRDPAGLRASNEDRRFDALDGWIGDRWECVASILSLLVVL